MNALSVITPIKSLRVLLYTNTSSSSSFVVVVVLFNLVVVRPNSTIEQENSK